MSSDALGPFDTPSDGDETYDISGANMFTEEIENINASDWDVDSDLLWGDDGAEATVDIGDGVFDTDFPI